MILDLSKETEEVCKALGIDKRDVAPGERLRLAAALVVIMDRAAAAEQARIVSIVQRNRNVISPMDVVAEIRRPRR